MREIELLAPAGNFETMQAAIRAGADAVYLGGGRFGARAYAGNLTEEELLRGIDYVHLQGKKLYLTVNTLLKEEELEEDLYAYIRPYYEEGLDAAIVQDLGVFAFLRREFPKLPIHASTQMTIAGPEGAKALERLGASRVVTPRELSLEEIRQIRSSCELEIESFVHGALCYCYSGQCLMSSMIGGRSGNRGRCAQPCRMNYQAFENGRIVSEKGEPHLLSPKDMNTLAILPDIIEAGVTSLKIEGRMKKPVYTAGVTEIYRKYVDRFLEYGKKGYAVAKEDQKQVYDLFNRNGFHESYYRQHNGKNMMAMSEKEFRFGNEPLAKRLEEAYMKKEKKIPVQMQFAARKNQPVTLRLCLPAFNGREEVSVTVSGSVPQEAMKQAATKEGVSRQIGKLGNTMFEAEGIRVDLEEGLFLPVVMLNDLRRAGIDALCAAVREKYVRALSENRPEQDKKEKSAPTSDKNPEWRALAVTMEQARVLLKEKRISRIYVESEADSLERLELFGDECRMVGKECYLAMPYVFRAEARKRFQNWRPKENSFDGYLVRSLDELVWLKEKLQISDQTGVTADSGLYTWNKEARELIRTQGAKEDTAPVELNRKELIGRGMEGSEWVVYGRVPMMVSAQCVRKNTEKCLPGGSGMELIDRMGAHFPVRFVCTYCYNVIYNHAPISCFSLGKDEKVLQPEALRLNFSVETPKEVEQVLSMCMKEDPEMFTRGHYKRGVE